MWVIPPGALAERQRLVRPQAPALYEDVLAGKVELCEPALWEYEVAGVIARGVGAGRMSEEEGLVAIDLVRRLQVVRLPLPPLAEAYRVARKFRRTLWDSLYLECTEQNSATFWTGDERLYNGVKDEWSWVKWIGNYPLRRRRARRRTGEQ